MLRTIQETINIAKISCYLSGNDNAKGSLFGARLNPQLQRLIYMEMRSLDWANTQSTTYTDIDFVANYVYALCGKYGAKAAAILEIGNGGSIAPITPDSFVPIPDFQVSSTSYIKTDENSITITNYIGYDVVFFRNGIPQYQINVGDGSSYFSWDRVTGEFFCFPNAVEGELFQIKAVI